MFIGRVQTLDDQVLVPYLIIHKKLEASINLLTEVKFFSLRNCQVKGDVTNFIHFILSFWIERQPPEKKTDKLKKQTII